jgi:hypothetical protein
VVTVHFLGRVTPPGVKLSIGYTANIAMGFGSQPFLKVLINDSLVDVECQLEDYDHTIQLRFVELYIRAMDSARAAVDLVSFASGVSQTVILENFVDHLGKKIDLAFYNPELGTLCTAYRLDDASFGEMYNIVLSYPPMFMALRDLIEAITLPHIGPINCGRVLDALRRMVAGDGNPGPAWGRMQAALNVSRTYREYITNASANPRHADRSFIPGDTVNEIVLRTWIVFNRLLIYKKRMNAKLTAPEFPLL